MHYDAVVHLDRLLSQLLPGTNKGLVQVWPETGQKAIIYYVY